MTRLFIRFYVGVILILLAAWFVQRFVSRYRVDEQNARVVEQAMAGSLRLARDWFRAEPDNPDILEELNDRFEYPVEVFQEADEHLPGYAQVRLETFDRIVLYLNNGPHVATKLDEHRVVSMGPLPEFVEPAQETWLTGLGVVLLLVAAAIAVLLRPVARQLRAIEKMAKAISEGNLNARIEPKSVSSGRSLAEALNSMADQTQSMIRTQRELLQAVSHDLRTPLAKMRFAIDLAASAKTEEERKMRLDSLDSTTEELDGLVGELLQYVRLETDVGVASEEIAVHDVVENVLDRRREMHPNLNFSVRMPASLQLNADPRGVQRVLDNLVSNACRFAKQKILISTSQHNGSTSLVIEDDGPGIPAEERERVLNPFVRLGNGEAEASPRQRTGVGLGLALVARILKRHGGKVEIGESSLGGCQVVTTWPVR